MTDLDLTIFHWLLVVFLHTWVVCFGGRHRDHIAKPFKIQKRVVFYFYSFSRNVICNTPNKRVKSNKELCVLIHKSRKIYLQLNFDLCHVSWFSIQELLQNSGFHTRLITEMTPVLNLINECGQNPVDWPITKVCCLNTAWKSESWGFSLFTLSEGERKSNIRTAH